MESEQSEILVLGIGNLLWADEGFGVRAVEALGERHVFPDRVRLMDGGTQGLYLLPYLQAAARLIVFDAVDYGLPPGTLKVVRDGEIPAYLGVRKMSLHQTHFQELLALARLAGRCPREMVLIGVQPEDISDYGGSLRAAVRAQIPAAIGLALAVFAEWGVPHRARPVSEAAALHDRSLDVAAYEAGRPSADRACRIGDARVLNRRAGEEPV